MIANGVQNVDSQKQLIWRWDAAYVFMQGHNALMAVVCLSVCLSVCPSVCPVPDPNSRTEGHSKLKIARKEAHDTGDPWLHLDVERYNTFRGRRNFGARQLVCYGDVTR